MQEIVDAIQASDDGSTAPPDAEVRRFGSDAWCGQ